MTVIDKKIRQVLVWVDTQLESDYALVEFEDGEVEFVKMTASKIEKADVFQFADADWIVCIKFRHETMELQTYDLKTVYLPISKTFIDDIEKINEQTKARLRKRAQLKRKKLQIKAQELK